MSNINQTERARLAWDALTEVAKNNGTVTYGWLGSKIGIHHRAVRYVLGPIQDYCMECRLPPLTILVVNGSGRPGTGFIAHDHNDLDGGLEAVWNFPWSSTPNPFDFASEGLSYPSLIDALTQHPEEAEAVYTKVKNRGVQQILFRDAVRKAYAWRCAFSGIEFPHALDASHIIPWAYATPQQRLDVRNGLLLNPLHHRLFDNSYLTITTEFSIQYYDPLCSERSLSELEQALTTGLHNKIINLPRLTKLRPLPEYIQRHNELIEWQID